mmetsp:Transcript_8681/g.16448  ORF Transcript_8681/g.16448 Transcript_8681/m.16448 type:complete len:160 (-) Transcript_8681:107-586(-)|eukprot:CAMPEP_0172711976 /NCGR_PEP_ID=MMETSP1074-20121228/60834_1 /TAXON_ID=2916 /ORGANISM="Ceratium fusus, Strain PA161109" /LENGTH=159 /DNA_ID=CAMNT_0013535837 /DNA_START=50 /DNA_END=529 /DNA_ORIENTATION=-
MSEYDDEDGSVSDPANSAGESYSSSSRTSSRSCGSHRRGSDSPGSSCSSHSSLPDDSKESHDDISSGSSVEPRGDDEAPVSLSSNPTPSEARGVPVADHGSEKNKRSSIAKTTLTTWGQLKTEVQALSELLEGVRAVRVKQEEYLQRLVAGPPSSTPGG